MNARVTVPLLTVLFVMGVALSAAARVSAQATTSVQIETVSVIGTTLTIHGRNFGASMPTVSVNDINASISRSSDTEIVAVTAALEPGMHILKVVRDGNEGGTAVSTLQIR